jgi:hypothetical protein
MVRGRPRRVLDTEPSHYSRIRTAGIEARYMPRWAELASNKVVGAVWVEGASHFDIIFLWLMRALCVNQYLIISVLVLCPTSDQNFLYFFFWYKTIRDYIFSIFCVPGKILQLN